MYNPLRAHTQLRGYQWKVVAMIWFLGFIAAIIQGAVARIRSQLIGLHHFFRVTSDRMIELYAKRIPTSIDLTDVEQVTQHHSEGDLRLICSETYFMEATRQIYALVLLVLFYFIPMLLLAIWSCGTSYLASSHRQIIASQRVAHRYKVSPPIDRSIDQGTRTFRRDSSSLIFCFLL